MLRHRQFSWHRSTIRWLGGAATLLLTALVADASAGQAAKTPNIILIVADDLGYAELGCYGQKKIKTPNIDALAREGIRFTPFYSGAPVCAPARCTLMTGKHTGHAYIRNNGDPKGLDDLRKQFGWEFPGQNPIPAEEVTIAELLKAKGYATGAIGKWGLGHFGTSGDPTTQGFDLFYGYNCQRHAHNHYPRFLWRNRTKEELPGNDGGPTGKTHSQDRFTAEALAFIREHKSGPFFLYLPLTIPHVSIQVPDEALQEYKGKLPESDYVHRDNYAKHATPHAAYAAMISHMDRAIGQIMALVKEQGLDENTLVLFTSDNGPTHDRVGGADSDFFESSGPLRGRKGSVYEGGIRVPLIARWPGKIKPGRQTDHVAAFWDVLPTLCDVAGIEKPDAKQIDGLSFAPTFLGEGKQPTHEYLYWEFPAYGGQQAIRAGDWKAVRTNLLASGERKLPESAPSSPLRTQLYNLADDLGEQTDVAAKNPEVLARLESLMQAAHTPSELFPFAPLER